MSTKDTYIFFVQDVLITLHANIRDLEEKLAFADPEEKDYILGRIFSYKEVLETIRMAARSFGIDKEELGI